MFRLVGWFSRTLGLAVGLIAGYAVTPFLPGAQAQNVSSLVLTSPHAGATLSGTVVLTAISGSPDLEGLQFKVNGVALGPEITSGTCSAAWNTLAGSDGSYSLTVVGRDSFGAISTSPAVPVTVHNSTSTPPPPGPPPPPSPPPPPPPPPSPGAPEISAVASANVTTTGASVVWSTNQPSTSEVEFGTTPLYGSLVSDPAMVTQHVVELPELVPGTIYHFRVRSANAQNEMGVSPTFVFTTAPLPTPDPGPPPQDVPERVEQIIGRRPQAGQTKLDAQRHVGAIMPGRAVNVRDLKASAVVSGANGANTATGDTKSSGAVAAPKAGTSSAPATGSATSTQPAVVPLPGAQTSGAGTAETSGSGCTTPDPFAHLRGLVGVCQRGIWIPVVRDGKD